MVTRVFAPREREARLYQELSPKYSFSKYGDTDWEKWQKEFYDELKQLLGWWPERVPLEAERIEVTHHQDYTAEKVVFQSEKYATVSAVVLIPRGCTGKVPAVICLHGHGPGKRIPLGAYENEQEKELIVAGERDYAIQAVKEGYVSISIDMRAFGEAKNPEDAEEAGRSSCRSATLHSFMLGRTMVGERVWDVMRTIDYLETRPEIDPDKIICMGQSGGGTITLFSAALEPRISNAIVSCYFCTFKDSIMSIYHCEDNYVPGILRLGEMYDIAGLIAPRPLMIVAGQEDPIFPIEGVDYAYSQLEKIYSAAGVSDRLSRYVGSGGHRFYKEKVWEWVKKWL
jgi:cephalosporin-C deacetylase-like acetyl esterase